MRLANAEDGDVAAVVAAIAEEKSIDLAQAATVYIAKDTRESSEVCGPWRPVSPRALPAHPLTACVSFSAPGRPRASWC